MLVMVYASNLFRVTPPQGSEDHQAILERLDHQDERMDHQDELLHRVLSIVEPVGRFVEANKHLIEKAEKIINPLGLRGRAKGGRNGRG